MCVGKLCMKMISITQCQNPTGPIAFRIIWGQKLGHQVRSKENLVNTLEVTLLKYSIIMNLA